MLDGYVSSIAAWVPPRQIWWVMYLHTAASLSIRMGVQPATTSWKGQSIMARPQLSFT